MVVCDLVLKFIIGQALIIRYQPWICELGNKKDSSWYEYISHINVRNSISFILPKKIDDNDTDRRTDGFSIQQYVRLPTCQ